MKPNLTLYQGSSDPRQHQKTKRVKVKCPLASTSGSAVQRWDALGYLIPADTEKSVALGALARRWWNAVPVRRGNAEKNALCSLASWRRWHTPAEGPREGERVCRGESEYRFLWHELKGVSNPFLASLHIYCNIGSAAYKQWKFVFSYGRCFKTL